jgi:hypothetical protein
MSHCCDRMTEMLAPLTCKLHTSPFDCSDCLVCHSDSTNRYGIIIHDGGTSSIEIAFCPWCGAPLTKTEK